ncbi:lysophospholipid acyltransferase family protein [Phytohabitans rumicis]|uniref:1-acyl-sn-glycerol-3-phosphate acyltransferase n=1 Tax=Phytohabitans rumicis TaxID=1076125 RepID=A0A6V8LJJ4_9ACTN|nr:lysophospholipid acyltransferase family protein [Phytohabitans rumicis]GFJ95038.1 1-acyl-sn-glycerol-3-phosphate acyltransferase [Phytohabitans rumicis]
MLVSVTRRMMAPPLRLLYRPAVEGRHHVPRRGPVILASNHLSFVDSLVIPLVAPRPVAFLAKAEYFDVRLTRWLFTGLGAVPVRRGAHRAALASLDAAMEVLGAGGAFGIYPEGTRSRDGRLYRGRTGVGWLALTARAPVVPVAVAGTDDIQPIGARLPRIRPVTVRFGVPLTFDPSYGEPGDAQARRRVTDEIMDRIAELSGQERVAAYNTAPAGENSRAPRGPEG